MQGLHEHPQEPPFEWEIQGAAHRLSTFIVRRCEICGRELFWVVGKGWCEV